MCTCLTGCSNQTDKNPKYFYMWGPSSQTDAGSHIGPREWPLAMLQHNVYPAKSTVGKPSCTGYKSVCAAADLSYFDLCCSHAGSYYTSHTYTAASLCPCLLVKESSSSF